MINLKENMLSSKYEICIERMRYFTEIYKQFPDDPEIIKKANEQLTLTPEIFYLKSFYLIDEEAHPLLFDMDLENPQDLPDEDYEFLRQDLSS